MSAEIPSQEPKPTPRKRKPPAPKPQLDWLSGRAHWETIRMSTCECEEHRLGALIEIIKSGVQQPTDVAKLYNKYTDINLKVHHSNREAGWVTPSQEAENILLFEAKKNLDNG